MSKYRKKPIVIEAEQFSPDVTPWPEGVWKPAGQPADGYRMDTLEGPFKVTPGDWIITGIKGGRYPCKPDIFETTYEKVEPYSTHPEGP